MEKRFKKIKIIAVIFVLVLIFGGVFLILKREREKDINKADPTAQVLETLTSKKDSDNDGLLDWEEKLYGTDPKNPDTDGDGYLDGEEINSSHNPLKPAPGDELTNFAEFFLEQENLTENLAQSLIDRGLLNLDLNQGSKDTEGLVNLKDESLTDFLDTAILNLDNLLSAEIKDEELNIAKSDNKETKEQYLQTIKTILSKNFSSEGINLIEIVENPDNSQIKKIKKIVENYEKAISQIKELPVPTSLKDLHKEELSLLITSKKFFDSLSQIEEDPLKAYLAMLQFSQLYDRSIKLGEEFDNLIKNEGLTIL